MKYKLVDEKFLSLPTIALAEKLVGKILVRNFDENNLCGRIVETEAYLPENDSANHAHIGKTKRNNSLFLEYGHFYVYSIHQYYCLNLVAEKRDIPGCVLIRAVELQNDFLLDFTKRDTNELNTLTNGPGKICKIFGIDKRLDGQKTSNNTFNISLYEDGNEPVITKTPRIGIRKNTEKLLRFVDARSRCLSR